MAFFKFLLLSALVAVAVEEIYGHGMLMEPVNRSSAWRKGFNTKTNFNDQGNYCGGLSVMVANGGKCGVCGDNYRLSRPRPNENTGIYGSGTIVKTYKAGQEIELEAKLTANHGGFFRFSLCPLSKSDELETEECFEKYPLKLADGSDKYIVRIRKPGLFKTTAILPEGFTCEHCVLRWEYVAGNNWGICPDGRGRPGCGPQETFRTCSDVKIV